MIECVATTNTLVWILTGLILFSDWLGETKWVKANSIPAFIIGVLEFISRLIRKILFGR